MRTESKPALLYEIDEPPDFDPELGGIPICQYVLIEVEGEHVVYVPEDEEIIRGAEAVSFIARLAPLARFAGAVNATINIEES